VIAPENSVLISQVLAVAPPSYFSSQTADRRGGVCTIRPLKLWSYWTEVHQMFT